MLYVLHRVPTLEYSDEAVIQDILTTIAER